jgi:hypothetical protein
MSYGVEGVSVRGRQPWQPQTDYRDCVWQNLKNRNRALAERDLGRSENRMLPDTMLMKLEGEVCLTLPADQHCLIKLVVR